MHISCSTVSPTIARKLQGVHQSHNMEFVSSPVFARPDGISRREATFMLSGKAENKAIAQKYLALLGRTEDIGEEIGAANVVKLCGNFLIAVREESLICLFFFSFFFFSLSQNFSSLNDLFCITDQH